MGNQQAAPAGMAHTAVNGLSPYALTKREMTLLSWLGEMGAIALKLSDLAKQRKHRLTPSAWRGCWPQLWFRHLKC